MKESNLEIEHLVDCFGIEGASDLSMKQRMKIVSLLTKEQDADELLEGLIEGHSISNLPSLVSEIYQANNTEELLSVAKKIQDETRKSLKYHYDDIINDVISDYRWAKFDDRLNTMNNSSRQDCEIENQTPYGPAFTLGGR